MYINHRKEVRMYKENHVIMIFCEDFDETLKVLSAVQKGLKSKRLPLYKFSPDPKHVCHECKTTIMANRTNGKEEIILCPSCGSHVLRS